jgi:hypothetical protein
MVNLAFGDGSALRFAGRYKPASTATSRTLGGGDGYNSTDTGAVRLSPITWSPDRAI